MTRVGNIRGQREVVGHVALPVGGMRQAEPGEFRVFNQVTEWASVQDVAEAVRDAYWNDVRIEHLDNPRVEAEDHYYNVVHSGLKELGLEAHLLSDTLYASLLKIADAHANLADPRALTPAVDWRRTHNPSSAVVEDG